MGKRIPVLSLWILPICANGIFQGCKINKTQRQNSNIENRSLLRCNSCFRIGILRPHGFCDGGDLVRYSEPLLAHTDSSGWPPIPFLFFPFSYVERCLLEFRGRLSRFLISFRIYVIFGSNLNLAPPLALAAIGSLGRSFCLRIGRRIVHREHFWGLPLSAGVFHFPYFCSSFLPQPLFAYKRNAAHHCPACLFVGWCFIGGFSNKLALLEIWEWVWEWGVV